MLILALVAMLTMLVTRGRHGIQQGAGHPGIADNETMLIDADGLCIGDSNAGIDPVGRVALANMPWRRAMGMPPLRQASVGPRLIWPVRVEQASVG
jgi:hypothetical protein